MTWRALAVGLGCMCALTAACRNEVMTKSVERSVEQGPKDLIVLSAAEQQAGRIDAAPATITDQPTLLRVTGRITRADDRTCRVGVRTEGLVVTVHANLGDLVRKGDVLARYHADELREERARYRTARSNLQRVDAARAQAQRNVDRMQTLLDLKAASAVQVEQARQDLIAAESAVKNAQIEVERSEHVLEEDLGVPADPPPGDEEAEQVPILAPAAGFVLEKNVTPGRTVAPGQDAYVISDLSQVWMLAAVRQENMAQLHVGQPATVRLLSGDSQGVAGRITNLGQEFDPITRLMPVRIVLNNAAHRLRPEMLAAAEIPIAPAQPTLVVSSDAIQQVNDQDVVFVQTARDHFVLRPVRTGPTADGRTPVLEGLRVGERVVVRGSFVLKSHLLRSTFQGE